MSFETLDQGIDPGGLRDMEQIQLLICYVLEKVKAPLTPDDIISVLQKNSIANYFASAQALSELIKNGNIVCSDKDDNKYTVSDSGTIISNQLGSELPASVKDKAIGSVLMLLEEQKAERENDVKIKKNAKGYTVSCNISDSGITLFSFELYVPEQTQAQAIKRNFNKNPDLVYQVMISMMTGNKAFAREVLNNIQRQPKRSKASKEHIEE